MVSKYRAAQCAGCLELLSWVTSTALALMTLFGSSIARNESAKEISISAQLRRGENQNKKPERFRKLQAYIIALINLSQSEWQSLLC